MKLKYFKNHIESFLEGTEFNYSISVPFSWRGSYDGVAFTMKENSSTREDILSNIELAYTETFRGYKGGYGTYNDDTSVHFEDGKEYYSAGVCCAEMIADIERMENYNSEEERLINLAFKK